MVASTFGSIHSFVHSTTFMLAGDGLLLLVAVVWLGLAFRVHRDARRRIDDGRLVGAATLTALALPFLGPLLYLLFRPPETLADANAREIEMRALRDRLSRPNAHCPVCLSDVEDDYLVCPVCTTRLREPCPTCDAALDPLWQACPYCATRVPTMAGDGAVPLIADLDAALSREAPLSDGFERRQAS
jgi:Double zinc ribbon